MRMLSYGVYLVCFFMMSCASHQSTTTAVTTGKYSEDLSSVRPKVEALPVETVTTTEVNVERKQTVYVEPKHAINQSLDGVLDSINHNNLTHQSVEGYTIQVYSGSKREEALNIKRQLNNWVPQIESEVQFTQPNFRVKAGKYFQRLDAQKDYLSVKRYFPNAILIPDRIAIN